MQNTNQTAPNSSAVRTALWRGLHGLIDAKPLVIEDSVGLQLANPQEGWQERLDMKFTKPVRGAMVGRARLLDDYAIECSKKGIHQYVSLGAGLDTLAQRLGDSLNMQIFEIDEEPTLTWKEGRLKELNLSKAYQHFVPVNFIKSSWFDILKQSSFKSDQPSLLTCVGVTLYLDNNAVHELLKNSANLAKGSKIVIAFYLPSEALTGEDLKIFEMSKRGAASSGTPFISFFMPNEIIELATKFGLQNPTIINRNDMIEKYFKDRPDQLIPTDGEFFLVADV